MSESDPRHAYRRTCLGCAATLNLLDTVSGLTSAGWWRTPLGYLCPTCHATGHIPGYAVERGETPPTAIPTCGCGWRGRPQISLAGVGAAWTEHRAAPVTTTSRARERETVHNGLGGAR